MDAFIGLMKKEWKIGRSTLFTIVILEAALMFISFLAFQHYGREQFWYITLFPLMLFHLVAIPVFLLRMLSIEGKSQLWLHNPQGGSLLLGTKTIMAFMFHCISLIFVLAVYGSTVSVYFKDFQVGFQPIFSVGLIITLAGLMLAAECLILWTIYHAMTGIKAIKKIRWLLIAILFVLMNMGLDWLQDLAFYQKLDEYWRVDLFNNSSFQFSSENMDLTGHAISMSLMSTLFDAVICGILFCLAVWLLNRKIEV